MRRLSCGLPAKIDDVPARIIQERRPPTYLIPRDGSEPDRKNRIPGRCFATGDFSWRPANFNQYSQTLMVRRR